MSLKDLPNELILEISFLLPSAGDFKRFALADRSLFTFLRPILFKRFAKGKGSFTIALYLSAESGNEENLRLLLENQHPKVIDTSTSLINNNAGADEIINVFAKDLSRYVLIDRVYERSPLFWAMVENRGNLLAKFLKIGVGVDLVDYEWYTPLYWAVMNGTLDTCRLLLHAGATVSERGFRTKLLPLHVAVIHRQPKLTELLLKFGPDTVNEQGEGEFTPLILALFHNKRKTARVLLKNGADPHSFTADRAAMDLLHQCGTNAYMHSGLRVYTPSPLRYAIMEHELEVLGMILHGKVDSLDAIGATSLQHAASDHDPVVVKFLLGMGASVDYMGDRGYTALMQASASGCCLTIQALLDGGANINARCRINNRTALHWAVLAGPNAGPSIKKLLEKGIDANALDIHEKSAISYATEEGNWGAFLTLFMNYFSR